MGFLDTYDDGDNEAPESDRIYLDKRQPGDYIFEVVDAGIRTHDDEHQDYPGQEYFLAKLKVLDRNQGQVDGKEGTVLSYYVEMAENMSKTRKDFSLKDVARFCAGLEDKPMNYFLEEGKIAKRINDTLEDDWSGTKLQGLAKDGKQSNGTTWYNYRWYRVDEDDE